MDTPLRAAVEGYLGKDRSRLHMPGHKGRAVFPAGEAARYDVTEVDGTDSLYEAAGAIAELEKRYAKLYGAHRTLLSAGGGTLCIQAMLAAACPPGSAVVCARGVHTAAVNAMALLDLRPAWVWPEPDGELGLMKPVTPAAVEEVLQSTPGASAVYITSPNYYGLQSDITGISSVCRRYGIPLLVDNAHGAHLKFLPPVSGGGAQWHPLDQGAQMCCDSLHKTLPVLTGGALLHVADPALAAVAKGRMALFGSTSPSYLIMLSVDGALDYLSRRARVDLAATAAQVSRLERMAVEKGFALPQGRRDPTRLTLGFAMAGYTPREFAKYLRFNRVEPEFLDSRFAVLLPGGCEGEDFVRLEQLLRNSVSQAPLPGLEADRLPRWAEQACSLREAALAPWESLAVEAAVGRVAGSVVTPCPPGIPLLVPGERIRAEFARLLKKAGISCVNVLK